MIWGVEYKDCSYVAKKKGSPLVLKKTFGAVKKKLECPRLRGREGKKWEIRLRFYNLPIPPKMIARNHRGRHAFGQRGSGSGRLSAKGNAH